MGTLDARKSVPGVRDEREKLWPGRPGIPYAVHQRRADSPQPKPGLSSRPNKQLSSFFLYYCHLHAPQVCVEPADVDVQPVVGVLREPPLLVCHAQHEVDATVDLILNEKRRAMGDEKMRPEGVEGAKEPVREREARREQKSTAYRRCHRNREGGATAQPQNKCIGQDRFVRETPNAFAAGW